MNGPSTCTPSTLAPPASAGTTPWAARRAAQSWPIGAVMNVGKNAVVPVSGSRRAISAHPAAPAVISSTPK